MTPTITLMPAEKGGTYRDFQAYLGIPGIASFTGTGADISEALIDLAEKMAEFIREDAE